jgi:predicted PurR-regulated permease PerM
MEERIVRFRLRTILAVIAMVLAAAAVVRILSVAGQVITWVLISIFLALALNPAVEFFRRRVTKRRGLAIGLTYLVVLLALAALAATFVPTLVDQTNQLIDAAPGYVSDLTEGRGVLGRFADKYNLVERVQEQVNKGGAERLLGYSGTAIAVTRGVVTAIVALVTIAVMTFFMLLEGPAWVDRFFTLVPEHSQERWRRVAHDIYRTVGGYVSGNLTISLIAGVSSAIVLSILGVPYSIALGLLVAILDLIPLAGATMAAILVGAVAFLHSITAGIVVVVFFVLYQQLENHVLQPLVYGRTVQLSPLVVLIAVLFGAQIAGVLGALGAIPVAGTIQVLVVDWLRHRRGQVLEAAPP